MIATWKEPRTVQSPKIGDFLDHAQQPIVALGIAADTARIAGIDIAAARAGRQLVGDGLERCQKRLQCRFPLLHQMQDRATRRPRAKARETRERLCQSFDLVRCHGPRISGAWRKVQAAP